MVEQSKVNVKLSDSQLNKLLKSAVKSPARVALRINIKMFHGNNLPRELLWTTRQKTKRRNVFENNMPTDINLSKTQISKIIQSGGFLVSLFSKLAGPFMKVAVPLAKHILAPLGITAAASAIDAVIQKKIHASGRKILIISNKEMNDIMKVVRALEDSNILLKGITKTIKMKQKNKKEVFQEYYQVL